MYKLVKSKGNHIVEMEASKIGDDFNISIYGGGRPHIGEAAMATYNRSRNVATVVGLTADSSKEGIAQRAARHLAQALKATVCVTCGIHCEMVADEEVVILNDLVDELVDNIKVQFA